MTQRLEVSRSYVSRAALLVVSCMALWSPQARAGSIGYIGQTYHDRGGDPPPPPWGQACLYTGYHPCFYCGDDVWNPWGSDAQGCSNDSQEQANANAVTTCQSICEQAKAAKQPPPWGVYRPAGHSQGTSVGAGTIRAVDPGVFVGHLPADAQVDPTMDFEQLANQLTEMTANPWLWLSGPAEFFTQDYGPFQGTYAEAYSHEDGEPEPRTACSYEAWSDCPCEGARIDGIRACSEEDDTAAWTLAESACPALCYQARSASWGAWGLLGVSRDEGAPRGMPGATLQAVEPGLFVAHVPFSLEPLGPTEDWEGLTDQLLELTQGADVWLAGPAEYFVCVEGAAR